MTRWSWQMHMVPCVFQLFFLPIFCWLCCILVHILQCGDSPHTVAYNIEFVAAIVEQVCQMYFSSRAQRAKSSTPTSIWRSQSAAPEGNRPPLLPPLLRHCPTFEPEVFRKQIHDFEESICDIVWIFRRPLQWFGVRELCPLASPRYVPVHSVLQNWWLHTTTLIGAKHFNSAPTVASFIHHNTGIVKLLIVSVALLFKLTLPLSITVVISLYICMLFSGLSHVFVDKL